MNKNGLRIFGTIIGLIGFGVTLIGNWISDKQTEILVEEKVKEALSDREEED